MNLKAIFTTWIYYIILIICCFFSLVLQRLVLFYLKKYVSRVGLTKSMISCLRKGLNMRKNSNRKESKHLNDELISNTTASTSCTSNIAQPTNTIINPEHSKDELISNETDSSTFSFKKTQSTIKKKKIIPKLINKRFRSRTVYNQMVTELINSKVNHESPLNIDKIKTKAEYVQIANDDFKCHKNSIILKKKESEENQNFNDTENDFAIKHVQSVKLCSVVYVSSSNDSSFSE